VGVFFIFGTARSGTTLLATSLSQHSRLFVPRETDFVVPLVLIADRIPNEELGKRLIADFIVGSRYFGSSIYPLLKRPEIEEAIACAPYTATDMLNSLYGRLAANAGKALAGDKSPNDITFLPAFLRSGVLESEAVSVIHVVRDVRDVALSLRNVSWGGRAAAEAVPLSWNASNLMLHHHGATGSIPNYRLVRYEDLVADPAETLAAVAAFLGFEFEEQMLRHEERGREWLHMPYHENLSKPFLTDRVGAWEAELEPDLLALCERDAREGMQAFGYAIVQAPA
jgi:hypothetical protein